jgi:hypothetical protein
MGWTTDAFEFQQDDEFSILHILQTGFGAHPTSYPMGNHSPHVFMV